MAKRLVVHVELSGRLPAGVVLVDVQKWCRMTLVAAKAEPMAYVVGFRLTDDEEVRRLNLEYRGKDKTTDVLSFQKVGSEWLGVEKWEGKEEKEGEKELGDIVISLPQVRRQAKEIGRRTQDEFCLMVVHGTLHLLGLDHESLEDETRMFAVQHEVLVKLGVI